MKFRVLISLLILILRINPTMGQVYKWTISLGDSNEEDAKALAVDNLGNIIIAGNFSGVVDFNKDGEPHYLTSNGKSDIYLAKYNTTGNLVWAFNLGGEKSDYAFGISCDKQNNILVTGSIRGAPIDMDPSNGIHLVNTFADNCFVAKYDKDGNYKWAVTITDSMTSYGYAIAADTLGNSYITGTFKGSTVDFCPGNNSYFLSSNGPSLDIFLLSLDSSGNFRWAFNAGGEAHDVGTSVTIDGNSDVIITGQLYGSHVDLNPGEDSTSHTSDGNDLFIAKYNSAGEYLWSFNSEGNGTDVAYDLTTDRFNNIYIAGTFNGSKVDFDPGPDSTFLSAYDNSFDILLAKYSPDGDFVWALGMGESQFDAAASLDILNDDIYFTGTFDGDSVDFDAGNSQYFLKSNGEGDVFFVKYDLDGIFKFGIRTGDSTKDNGNAVACDQLENVFLLGNFSGNQVDFNPGKSKNYLRSNGSNTDVFLTKFSPIHFVIPESENLFSVYPNPITDSLIIKHNRNDDEWSFRITSELGVKIAEVYLSNSFEYTWDPSLLAAGIYILQLKSVEGSQCEKLIRLK